MGLRSGALFAALLSCACGPSAVGGNPSEQPPPVITIGIAPPKAALQVRQSAQFTATVTGSSDKAVTWSVRETGGGTVTDLGLYTAPSSAGVFHVVASSHADPGKTAEAEITVSAAPPEISISIDPARVDLLAGATSRFHATVVGSEDTAVTWSAPDGGSVDAGGLFTAPSLAGTFRVVVSAHADPAKTATATVLVSLPPPQIAVSITPQVAQVAPGASIQFQAAVTGTDDRRVQYSADGGVIDRASGLWTAPQSEGTVHVSVQSVADLSAKATATVTIVRTTVVTVKIQPNPITIAPGDAVWLIADVTGTTDRSVTWSIREGAAGGTINQSVSPARYFSPLKEGVFHVVATSNADPTAFDVATVTSSWNLRDGGGPVAAEVHAYALWWGDPAAFPADEKVAAEAFLSTIDGSAYLAIADQYLRGAKAKVTFSGALIDTSTPGDRGPPEPTTEICAQIAAHGSKPDPLGMYFVFTPSVPPGVTLCAWHSSTTCDGTTVLYAFMPSPTNYAACNYVHGLSCNDHSVPTQSVVNYIAHELMEAITDPYGTGWTGPGNEIGDKCNAVFDHCVTLAGAKWQIQEEWSNAAHACVQE